MVSNGTVYNQHEVWQLLQEQEFVFKGSISTSLFKAYEKENNIGVFIDSGNGGIICTAA